MGKWELKYVDILRNSQLHQIPIYILVTTSEMWCALEGLSGMPRILAQFACVSLCMCGSVGGWGLLRVAIACDVKESKCLQLSGLLLAVKWCVFVLRIGIAVSIWGVVLTWVVRAFDTELWDSVLYIPITIFSLVSMRTKTGLIAVLLSLLLFIVSISILIVDSVVGVTDVNLRKESLGVEDGELACDVNEAWSWSLIALTAAWGVLNLVSELPLYVDKTDLYNRLDIWSVGCNVKAVLTAFVLAPVAMMMYHPDDAGLIHRFPVSWSFQIYTLEFRRWSLLFLCVIATCVIETCSCAYGLWEWMEFKRGCRTNSLPLHSFIDGFEVVTASILCGVAIGVLLIAIGLSPMWMLHVIGVATILFIMYKSFHFLFVFL